MVWILTSIIVPIVVILLVIGIGSISIYILRRKWIIESQDFFGEELSKLEDAKMYMYNEVDRIAKIVKNDKVLLNKFHHLETLEKKFDDKLSIFSSRKGKYDKTLSTFSWKDYNTKKNTLMKILKNMQRTKSEFQLLAKTIKHQASFIDKEYYFYANTMKVIKKKFDDKRTLMEPLVNGTTKIIQEITEIERDYNENFERTSTDEKSEKLEEYSSKVMQFASIVNEGPILFQFVSANIPSYLMKLKTEYKNTKSKFDGRLDHINFASSLKNVVERFSYAKKKLYTELDVEECKLAVLDVLRSIKSLKKMINFEIRSHLWIKDSSKEIFSEYDLLEHELNNIKTELNSLVGKGFTIARPTRDLFRDAKNMHLELRNIKERFAVNTNTPNISYSAMLAIAKKFLIQLREFANTLNILSGKIWEINVESTQLLNALRKAEHAVNQITAEAKMAGIPLKQKHLNSINEADMKIASYWKKITKSTNIEPELERKVHTLAQEVTAMYIKIGGQIRLAETVSNMLKELGPMRALDAELNEQAKQVESLYQSGSYSNALSLIINHLKGEKYV